MCKGELENKNTTFMVELDQCIIITKRFLLKFAGNAERSHIVMKWLKN